MTRHVLVTRPDEDALPLAERLRTLGFDVSADPMVRIEYAVGPPPDLDGVRAILITSANGVRAFARCSDARDKPVFAVGDASAAAARAAGFTDVCSADGDVRALAALVERLLKPEEGTLLHVAGSATAGDLTGDLSGAGFTVRRDVLYEAKPAERLSPETAVALHQNRLDAVLLFSPRTATIFVSLVRAAGLEDALASCTAFCLSTAVAEAADARAWAACRIAARPNQNALIEALEAWRRETA